MSTRVLELRQKSSLTGEVRISRVKMILPATRYEPYLKQGWVDVTEKLTPDEFAAVPDPSPFDGA